jgi:hypothetical protein
MKSDFQDAKNLVRQYYQKLDAAKLADISSIIAEHTTEQYLWRGMHPFYEQNSAQDVAAVFWQPLRQSIKHLQRRQDIFMAGLNVRDNGSGEWVVSMGNLMGLFDEDWLGIPATRKMVFLPYVEFNHIEDGKIIESAMFCDIISVMLQAGLKPLPIQTGAQVITPGPQTHKGLMYEQQDSATGQKTLDLITKMMLDLTSSDMESDGGELRATWHEDMIWWGPQGIGATYTLERYEEQHQGPFNDGLTDIVFNDHVCRLAEGEFGGWFGWANLSMKTSGGFLGMPASDCPTEMRVVDIYRRDGGKLAENWIFIDLLHFLHLQGLDVLGRLKSINT